MQVSLRKFLIDAGLCVLLVLLVVVIPLIYVGREQFFYAWDFRGYQQTAINQVNNLQASPTSLLRTAFDSLGDDYNALYTLPLAPLMVLLGKPEARTTYILSLALVYYLAYAVLLGLVFASMVRQQHKAAFWTGAFVAVLLPYTWTPALRGYPDTSGAIAIALATLVYLKDPRLKRWWQIVITGVCLALAVLFRRHFGYAVTAFLITLVVMALVRFFTDYKGDTRPSALRELASNLLRTGLIGLTTAVTILVLGYPFVAHVLSQNFLALYSSFETSLAALLSYYRGYYGWAAILLAIAGLVIGFSRQVFKNEAVLFVTLLGLVGFLQWVAIVRQVNPHYSLHFSFFILLGISASVWLILFFTKGYGRLAGGFILAGCLVVSSLAWFGVTGLAESPVARAWLPKDIQPLRRADYSEISRLVKYLRSKTNDDQTIYVVDSSALINADLLNSADQALYPQGRRLNILASPQVDSRDQYPLETLIEADFIVISDPLQRHLALEEQGVVSSIYDLFSSQAEITQDFSRLPAEFHLVDGIETSLYKRKRETSLAAALQTLQLIQTEVGTQPGSQSAWLVVSRSLETSVESLDSGYRLSGSIDANQPELTYLYLGPLPENRLLHGNLSLGSGCPDVQMRTLLANGAGEAHQHSLQQFSLGTENPFTISLSSSDWPYLIIDLTPASEWVGASNCSIRIDLHLPAD